MLVLRVPVYLFRPAGSEAADVLWLGDRPDLFELGRQLGDPGFELVHPAGGLLAPLVRCGELALGLRE